jgi:endoglucanase
MGRRFVQANGRAWGVVHSAWCVTRNAYCGSKFNQFTHHALRTLLTWSGLSLLLIACTAVIQPPTPAPVDDIFALNQRLGRGINLGNALEAPNYEGEWGLRLREEYFALIAEAGFQSVRVPIRWSAHAEAQEPYTIDPQFFERIDWVVEQALAQDLLVILDLHHMTEMMSAPELQTPRFLALWQQIAEHYQSAPPTVLFELLNEPNDQLTVERWNALIPQALAVIRATNPTRGVLIGPAQWNGITLLHTLELPSSDQHLIATVHYYEPFPFTHQGAEWVAGADRWLGTTWTETPVQAQAITSAFDSAAAWAQARNRPLFLGEFGAYSAADLESRARWTAFVARAAEQRGISWAYWEFGSGFGVYDPVRRVWNEALLQALIPPAP